MSDARALAFSEHGNPKDVLCYEERSFEPVEDDSVRLRMLASPINPSDLGVLRGSYGFLPILPAVGGREGIGEVIEIGSQVEHLKEGDWVRIPSSVGAWQTSCVAPAQFLWPLPKEIAPEQLSMAFVNPPTAWRLLQDFVSLKPGDWIIQNAAHSAVGYCVIKMAQSLGVNTINLVRDDSHHDTLKKWGAKVVLTEDDEYFQSIPSFTNGKPLLLGLNSVGGDSVRRLIRSLSPGGTCVTFGGMVGDPVRFPTRELIFSDVRLVGFWLERWIRTRSDSEVRALYSKIFRFMEDGLIQIPVAHRYKLSAYLEALDAVEKPGKSGKILFVSSN